MVADLPHILVVDDDDRLRALLQKYLSDNGFFVLTATDAEHARAMLTSLVFDLIVLDVMMPGESGLDFAVDLRRRSDVPILMLTAMGESDDRIRGLEHGADDYLTKPFEPRELLLRVNNILKRVVRPRTVNGVANRTITMGAARFDLDRGELKVGDIPIGLTTLEVQLLKALAEHPGEPLSRDDLIERTGAGTDVGGGGRAVDVQVTRLRRKIEADPKRPRYLQTVRGKGYTLLPD